jgi:outer membrane immunogenic protein
MKRILTASLLSFIVSGAALAADLPQPMPAPQAPVAYVPTVAPVYNWGGIYIGVNGGWGWGQSNWTTGAGTAAPFLAPLSWSTSSNGGVIGGTLGANFQWDALVLGVEGDWDYSGINTGTSSTICNGTGTCQVGNNWLATFRGRAGWAVDRVLFYATGGGAFANVQTTFNGVQNTRNQAGWTAGAGVEWAFADNWTARAEYLYVDLGSYSGTCASCTGGPVAFSANMKENLFRAGVDFKWR